MTFSVAAVGFSYNASQTAVAASNNAARSSLPGLLRDGDGERRCLPRILKFGGAGEAQSFEMRHQVFRAAARFGLRGLLTEAFAIVAHESDVVANHGKVFV